MKAILSRLRRLEHTFAPFEPSEASLMAEAILRDLAEERGEQYGDEPIDYTGCHTPAEEILRTWDVLEERERRKGTGTHSRGGAGL